MHDGTTRENAPTPEAASVAPAGMTPMGMAPIQLATPSIAERLADAEARAAAAEHELRLVRDRYAGLVTAAGHISWTTLPDGLVEDSPLWREYTGQTRDEVRGEGWLAAVHPHDRARTIAAWQQAVARETMYESEYRLRRADGIYHTFLDRGIPVREADGTVREWVGICVDIEDHKQTERALDTHLGDMSQLRELVTRFSGEDVQPLLRSVLRAVVELQGAMAGALLLCDPQHRELTIQATIGFSDEYLAMVGPVPYGIGVSGTVVNENQPVAFEDVRLAPQYAPYLPAAALAGYRAVYGLPLRATDGTILGTLTTYFAQPHRPSRRESALVDIYAHHAALLIEQAQLVTTSQRASTEAAVQASRLASVFDSIADAIFVYDTEGRILMSNQCARRMLSMDARPGYSAMTLRERQQMLAPADLHGRPLMDGRGRPVTRILQGETLASGEAEEMLLHLPDGREVMVSISGAPVRGSAGEITGAVVVLRDVSEHHRLQHEARLRARQLEAMFGAMADGAILMDARGRVTYMNEAAKGWTGLSGVGLAAYADARPEERMRRYQPQHRDGRPFTSEELPQSRILRGEVLSGAKILIMTMYLPMEPQASRERHFAVSGAPIRDEQGEVTGGVVLLRDVTEQIRLRDETQTRAAELEAILDTMPDAVSVLDRAGTIVRMNRAYRAMFSADEHGAFFRQSHQERVAQRFVEDEGGRLLAPEERPSSRALRGEIMTGASAQEMRVRLPWGQSLNVSISGAPIRDAAGEVSGAVLVSHDVTERHRYEERTRESLAALLAMAEAIVAGAQGPNHQPSDLYGLPVHPIAQRLAVLARKVLGCERVGIVSLGAEDRMAPIAAVGLTEEQLPHWWQSLDGTPMEHYIGAERLARLRDGEQVVLPLGRGPLGAIGSSAPTSLATPLAVEGSLVGAMAIDYGREPHEYTAEERSLALAVAQLAALVVERERLEQDRAAAQAETLVLQETYRRMQEFLSVAGHELKTPVTVIKANAQMLARWSARHGGLNPREGEMLDRTERQIERLMRLVNDLLDVTRIREGRLDLRPAPCNLVDITLEAVEELREIAPDRTITLHAEVAAVPLVADADRIGQVVTNYLTNALKYSEARYPVLVEVTVEQGRARVAVRDCGPGIPAEDIAHVWEEFRRVPGVTVLSGSGVGLGLGLHISREIIERHGGEVGVESAPGQGSTFWFTLPLRGDEGGVSA